MTVVGLNYGFAGQMKVDEITGGAPYGATTIAGLDAQRQPSKNELAGARYQGAPSRRPPRNSTAERRDQNAAGRWPRRPRNRAERVLAAWKRRRETRTAWNRPSTTCSPTSRRARRSLRLRGMDAAPGGCAPDAGAKDSGRGRHRHGIVELHHRPERDPVRLDNRQPGRRDAGAGTPTRSFFSISRFRSRRPTRRQSS